MKNNILIIAQKIIREGRLNPDRRSASWHHLTVQIVSDHCGDYLALRYPLSHVPGHLAKVEASWTLVRRFDQRWDATPSYSGVSVCGSLRQLQNRRQNDQLMDELIQRMS